MKIVISKLALEKAVKNICQVINKKCALPILGDINFSCYIGMKASSLIDSVGRLVEHEVEIQFADPSRAVTIRPLNPMIKDEEVTMLIIPMIINDSEK